MTTAPVIAVNDIGSAADFLAAIEGTIRNFNDGDLVTGTIVQVGREEVLVDIGYKTEGVIPSRELSIRHDVDPNSLVKVGETIEALVLQKEDKEGRLILSKKRAQYERAWGDIEGKKERDEVVIGTVIEVVKGGLIVDIGLRGFLPASLVEMRRVRDLTPYIGKQVEARIIELDKNRNNVVLSRRAFLEQTQSESRTTFLNQLQKGQVRTGVVSSIVNFGAFVDLGGRGRGSDRWESRTRGRGVEGPCRSHDRIADGIDAVFGGGDGACRWYWCCYWCCCCRYCF